MLILTNHIILLIFFLYCLLILINALAIKLNSRALDNIVAIMAVVTFIIIIFTRTGLGVDESTYLDAYQNYLSGGEVDFEYGVNFLFWFFNLCGVTKLSFNTVFPLLILAVLYFTINATVKSPFRSFVLIFTLFSSFYLDFSFNAYRQGLSFWFVLLSIEAMISGRTKRFFVFFVIGLGFHWSAAIVLLMVFLTRFLSIRIASYLNGFIFVLTIIAAIVPLHILSALAALIQVVSINSLYAQKIVFYLTFIKSSFYDLNFFGRAPLILSALILMLIMVLYRNYIPKMQFKLLVILLGYSVFLLEMSYSFRNYYWVLPFTPFIMAKIMHQLMKKRNVMLVFTTFSCGLWLLSIAGFFSFPILAMIFQ